MRMDSKTEMSFRINVKQVQKIEFSCLSMLKGQGLGLGFGFFFHQSALSIMRD